VIRKLVFTKEAQGNLHGLEFDPGKYSVYRQVLKALGFLETNPKHPGLHTHEYTSLGEGLFEAYAQNKTPCAYRIFFRYGPDQLEGKKRIPIITIIAITPHPR
jgi:hypothetical protein